MLIEAVVIGLLARSWETILALLPAYWLQVHRWPFGYLFANSSLMLSNVIRTEITPVAFVIGFIPGLVANVVGTAIAGIGIYKRQTATLMKELEA